MLRTNLIRSNLLQMVLEEEQNLEYLHERERAVSQLEADIGDVNQIFKDLAAMVHDQVVIYFGNLVLLYFCTLFL